GGPMTNGANHSGVINLGDLDMWTFSADQGDSLSLSMGVVGRSEERRVGKVCSSRGTRVGSNNKQTLAEINITAETNGLYTVLVASGDGVPQGTGHYVITVAQRPEPFGVSGGDEGGPMTNGANHSGVINLGDLDMWTFNAVQGDSLEVSMGVVG